MAKREDKIYVKPGEGRAPRHLFSGRRIAQSGEWVPNTPAFRRLILNEDLVRATPPTPAKKAGKAAPKKDAGAPKNEDKPQSGKD